MHCTNCNKEIDIHAVVCPGCGVPVNTVRNFCSRCGGQLPPGAAVCIQCGVPIGQPYNNAAMRGQKSKLAAGLFGIFLGGLGVHNFYLGYNGKAVAQLVLTILSCGVVGSIWGLIEGILILTGSINTDATGMPLGE